MQLSKDNTNIRFLLKQICILLFDCHFGLRFEILKERFVLGNYDGSSSR